MKALNAMLGGHDADGNGVNDLKFGKSFLLNLATEAEKLDYKTTIDHNTERGYRAPSDLEISQQSADPLAGILDAMGNND